MIVAARRASLSSDNSYYFSLNKRWNSKYLQGERIFYLILIKSIEKPIWIHII